MSALFTATHRLVLGGGDLLQEVGDALALRQPEAHALEERQHLPVGWMSTIQGQMHLRTTWSAY